MARTRSSTARRRSDLSPTTQPAVAEKRPAGACVHHWVLGDPAAGHIDGACRRCGESRQFPAAPESTQRFDDYRELTAPTAYSKRLSA
jgi:hypothetical protein